MGNINVRISAITSDLDKLSLQQVELETKYANANDDTLRLMYAVDLEELNLKIDKLLDEYNILLKKVKVGEDNE